MEETVYVALYPVTWGIRGGHGTQFYRSVGSGEGTWGFGGIQPQMEGSRVQYPLQGGRRPSLHSENCLGPAWDPLSQFLTG